MTTLGAWISHTQAGQQALYFVSDSRITWGSRERRWDAGRKIFVPYDEPHILGYCGDVVFPSLVLGQLVSAIDQKILFAPDASPSMKQDTIFNCLRTSWAARCKTPDFSFQILHAMRVTPWPNPSFSLWQIEYRADDQAWSSVEIPLNSTTSHLVLLGTGKQSASDQITRWGSSDVGGTSRSIFSAIHDSIKSGSDPLSGGSPQIAALYTALKPQTIGFVHDGKHYLHGLQLLPGDALSNIEWRDSLFQRIDPITMKVIKDARRFVICPL